MVRNGDVMRSDRLKQVMQQIDSNFDERNAGFNRFSKFVTEAGSKGLIKVTKLDNGQYEIAPVAGAPAAAPAPKSEAARDARTEAAPRGGSQGRRVARRSPQPWPPRPWWPWPRTRAHRGGRRRARGAAAPRDAA